MPRERSRCDCGQYKKFIDSLFEKPKPKMSKFGFVVSQPQPLPLLLPLLLPLRRCHRCHYCCPCPAAPTKINLPIWFCNSYVHSIYIYIYLYVWHFTCVLLLMRCPSCRPSCPPRGRRSGEGRWTGDTAHPSFATPVLALHPAYVLLSPYSLSHLS